MGEILPRPRPSQALKFDGERFTSDFGGQTAIEHWHRYLLAREIVRGRDVLDIACGEGYGTALMAQTARTVVGIDLSATAVTHAAGSYTSANLSYLVGSALEIPLADASIDVVVSFETLEHFLDHERFLHEVRRVLRPDGVLLISTPDRDNYSPADAPPNEYHRHELTTDQFVHLLRRHFPLVATQGQRVMLGSVLIGEGPSSHAALCFERRGETHFETSPGIARAKYQIAIAAYHMLPNLPNSIYIDTDQLFHIDGPLLERIAAGHPSPHSAARIRDLEDVMRAREADSAARIRDLEEVLRARATDIAAVQDHQAHLAAQLKDTLHDRDRLNTEYAALHQDRDRLATELRASDADRQRLAAELNACEQARAATARHLAESEALRAKQAEQVDALETYRRQLTQELRLLADNRNAIAEQLSAAEAEQDRLTVELDDIRAARTRTADELVATRQDRSRLANDVNALRDERDRLNTDLEQLRRRLDAVSNSTSWRWTAPLRRAGRILGRG